MNVNQYFQIVDLGVSKYFKIPLLLATEPFKEMQLMKNAKHRLFTVLIILLFVFVSVIGHHLPHPAAAVERIATKTPIKHLVVIYSENHSFDNGIMPKALH